MEFAAGGGAPWWPAFQWSLPVSSGCHISTGDLQSILADLHEEMSPKSSPRANGAGGAAAAVGAAGATGIDLSALPKLNPDEP